MTKQTVFAEENRKYFWKLYEEINNLINTWHYHREISVDITPENYDLMLKVAPNFYHEIMVKVLSHDIVMGIARSTEKRAKNKNDTFSIYGLPKRIPDISVRTQIEKLIKDKEPIFQKVEFWRDNHLAHHGIKFNDAENSIKRDFKNREVKDALDALSEIIHTCMPLFGFKNQLLNTDLDVLASRDMKRLFEVLKEGQKILDTKS